MATSAAGTIAWLKDQENGSLLLADLIEEEIGFAQIADDVVGPDEKRTGPSIGEYFLYAAITG